MTSLCRCDQPVFEGKLPEVIWRCIQCGTEVPKDEELKYPDIQNEVRKKTVSRSSLSLSWPRNFPYNEDDDTADQVFDILEEDRQRRARLAGFSYPRKRKRPLGLTRRRTPDQAEFPYYPYKPLSVQTCTKEEPLFRILLLAPGSQEDPLHGELITETLSNQPKYEALSYTWADDTGDRRRRKPLYLGNQWRRLPITKNCEAALRRFRDETETRSLWVDLVCINQEDDDERRQQVELMPEIYSMAQKVLAFLGTGSKRISDAMFALNSDNQSSREYGSHSYYINVIKELFSLPYFSRVWIIQELALARDASFYHSYDLQSLGLHHSREKVEYMLKMVVAERITPLWLQHCGKLKLSTWEETGNLVFGGMSSEASMPQDKIFAFFGMINGASAEGLVTDYDITVEEIYTGMAAFLISKDHLVDILVRANRGKSLEAVHGQPLYLPSWVPDFRCAAPGNRLDLGPQFRPVYIQTDSYDLRAQHVPETVLSRTGSLVIHGYRVLGEVSQKKLDSDYTYKYKSGIEVVIKFETEFNSTIDIIVLPCTKDSEPYALHLRKTNAYSHIHCYIFVGLCKIGLPYAYAGSDEKIMLHPKYFRGYDFSDSQLMSDFIERNSYLEVDFSPWRLQFSQVSEEITYKLSVNISQVS
ncbi:HET-domain-containing protein [Daldinia eschscholtzii]|nr:HET-domain-containing protein [Daldinia eschscholtzii]